MRIAILAYDGISPFMLSTPLAVFGEPFIASEHQAQVCSNGSRISANGGLTIRSDHDLGEAQDADIVILPGWRDANETVPPEITDVLGFAAENGATVVGLCLGAFGLAEAGLLNGLRATTHWARVPEFAARYPRVTVDPGAIFVDEGRILTSAGIAAGLDCCLHLLARISGIAEANRIARHLVVAPQRSGEQPQLIDRPAPVSSIRVRRC
jgi:transcriptional regulator GlxA family with amidase domain